MGIQQIRHSFNEKKGEQKKIKRDLKSFLEEKRKVEREISASEKAMMIISAIAQETQKQLQYRIEEPVSLALKAVYPEDPYKFAVDFQITNSGPIQCHLGFERNGFIISPLHASGGGPVDIASFALRIGALTLERPSPRKILILDESFKFVSRNKMELAGQLLKEISEKLNLQVIMITHIPELLECASKIVKIGIQKGKSYIKDVN